MTRSVTPEQRTRNKKRRDLNRHRGIPNRVDPAAAITRITALRATMSWADIAATTGCSAAYLRDIAAGRVPRINRVTHDKIMAGKPTPPARGLYLDATGTRRRVHALQAIGHTQQTIADTAGTTQYRVSLIATGRPQVRQVLADKIARAYVLLSGTPGASDHSRERAAALGWFGPEYWDDDTIDDPGFTPAVGARLGKVAEGELVAAEIQHLASFGVPHREIAARVGRAEKYVREQLAGRRAPGWRQRAAA